MKIVKCSQIKSTCFDTITEEPMGNGDHPSSYYAVFGLLY